jgi:DNA polymerase I-like protein with 3'-5' exonuclease and polymerase domains
VRYYEFFREKYVGVTDTQRSWINSVLADKELRTEWGLKYYWPDTRQDRSGYVTNSTSICNYPVQAFATAEIIPVGLVYFWHYARAAELQMKIVNTVHDSIITELPPEELEEFHELAQISLIDEVYVYLRAVYDIELVVPLGAGVMTGSHWSNSEAKDSEVTYTAKETQYERI